MGWSEMEIIGWYCLQYGPPAVALLLSIIALICSGGNRRLKAQVSALEDKLAQVPELEDRLGKLEAEQKKSASDKANLEARIVRVSDNEYAVKVQNTNGNSVLNVDFRIPPQD
jgi:hypothetical protein